MTDSISPVNALGGEQDRAQEGVVTFTPDFSEEVVRASAPYMLVSAWLSRRGLHLPALGHPLSDEIVEELTALAESEEGQSFVAAFNTAPELVTEEQPA